MDDKVKKVMGIVLDISPDEINEQTSTKTVENWDSINHMKLIVSLEDEFEIEFKDDEISDLISYKAIIKSVKSHNTDELS